MIDEPTDMDLVDTDDTGLRAPRSPEPGWGHPDGRAGGDGPDEVAIAVGAVTDGSAVLAHDGYDVTAWRWVVDEYGRLAQVVDEAGGRLHTAPALLRDALWSFYKAAPRVAPPAPLTAAHALNRQLIEEMLVTVEWRQVRAAGTIGDELTSAMATIGVATRVLAALDDATVAQANQLAEAERAAADLLAEADILDEIAQQAADARAAELRAQAATTRQAASQAAAEAARLVTTLTAEAPARADAVRRAARTGLAEATAEIDRTTAALQVFGAGAAVGAGSGGAGATALTLREKLDLARHVQQSPTLRQVAELAGRLSRVALQVQATRTVHPPDEVTSITVGADLARVLPSELALLGDPDLEDQFFLRLVERRLLTYELRGHEPQGKGPVIVALDNSGSMAGAKEIWSKAVALALLTIAGRQRRDLAVLHFGGTPDELRTFRFTGGRASPQDLIDCAAHHYGGGTTFAGWMPAALALIDEAAFDKADVVVISDGLVGLDPSRRDAWQRRRHERGMRVFAVLIGTDEGTDLLAGISDAVLTLDHLQDDRAVLATLFAI